VTGRLSRLDRLADWLAEITARGDVWIAALEDIAAHVAACAAAGTWQPRRHAFPYYAEPLPELRQKAAE
jgi:hypothetical protein